jgi:hypothetical protein
MIWFEVGMNGLTMDGGELVRVNDKREVSNIGSGTLGSNDGIILYSACALSQQNYLHVRNVFLNGNSDIIYYEIDETVKLPLCSINNTTSDTYPLLLKGAVSLHDNGRLRSGVLAGDHSFINQDGRTIAREGRNIC